MIFGNVYEETMECKAMQWRWPIFFYEIKDGLEKDCKQIYLSSGLVLFNKSKAERDAHWQLAAMNVGSYLFSEPNPI